jgi:Zn-finger nucleic acid-binding protein
VIARGAGALFSCPSCAAPMHRQSFARRPDGAVELDLCFACQSMWIDQYESSQLSPGGTIELFRLIHERDSHSARPVSDSAQCPLCVKRLILTHDIQRTNRFVYYRCPERHGRLITFYHFLREKQFVRSLSGAEIMRLQATVKTVRCSSCGAPVNVEKDAACAYCHAPLSILDADAVQRTLAELDAADHRPKPNVAVASFDALIEGRRVEQRLGHYEREGSGGIDLLREAIGLLGAVL